MLAYCALSGIARAKPSGETLLELKGAHAQAIYDAARIEASPRDDGAEKVIWGKVFVYCYRHRGISCSITRLPQVVKGRPPGIPPSPLWQDDADVARAFFAAFSVDEIVKADTGSKIFRADAVFRCAYRLVRGVRSDWACKLARLTR